MIRGGRSEDDEANVEDWEVEGDAGLRGILGGSVLV